MKNASKMLATAVAAGLMLSAAHTASAALIYSADPPVGGLGYTPATTAPDQATAAHYDDGTGGGGNLQTGYDSGVTVPTDFTMSAWVNMDNNSGDNMVFGTTNGSPMHLGFRNDQAYFGFWGNDSGSGGGVTPVGTWAHFIWSYDSTTGNQDIYENGNLISSSGGHPASQAGNEIWIASTNGNGGDMAGNLDDVRIYNTASTAASALALYQNSALSDVPEPASLGLVGLGALGLIARRRRA